MISLKPNAPFLEYPPSGAKICYDLVRGHYLFWVANSFPTAFFQFCSNQETKMAARPTQRSASTISRKNRGMWTVKNIWYLIIIQYMRVDRYATDSRLIFHRQSMINVSVECWPKSKVTKGLCPSHKNISTAVVVLAISFIICFVLVVNPLTPVPAVTGRGEPRPFFHFWRTYSCCSSM